MLHGYANGLDAFNTGIIGAASGAGAPNIIGSMFAFSTSAGATYNWRCHRNSEIPLGTYLHVAVTKTGTNAILYWNAQSAVNSAVTHVGAAVGEYITIGRADPASFGGGWSFHGAIDDVRIYNRALSPAEVASLYEYELGPRVSLLQAVKPLFSGLTIGTRYQLQSSSDLSIWADEGEPFTATATSMAYPQYWDVDNWGALYFRACPQSGCFFSKGSVTCSRSPNW